MARVRRRDRGVVDSEGSERERRCFERDMIEGSVGGGRWWRCRRHFGGGVDVVVAVGWGCRCWADGVVSAAGRMRVVAVGGCGWLRGMWVDEIVDAGGRGLYAVVEKRRVGWAGNPSLYFCSQVRVAPIQRSIDNLQPNIGFVCTGHGF